MNVSDDSSLDEILSLLPEETNAKNNQMPIPREKVNQWMQSDNIEVLGAVFYMLTDIRYYPYITPPLTVADYHPFMMHYYERCFLENPEGEWSDSRYDAGWSFVNWFRGLWDDGNVPRQMLDELSQWLAQLYQSGDEEVRTCIITATLEHLLERRDIAKHFAYWKDDPILKVAYLEAFEWSKNQPA